MADLLQPSTHAATHPVALADSGPRRSVDDEDFALGCECADPALQIERWAQEIQAPAADPH